MHRLPPLVAGLAIPLLIVPLVSAQPYLSPLVDFEGYPPATNDWGSPGDDQEMFQVPEWSGSTSAFIVANSPDAFDKNAAYRDDFLVIEGDASLLVSFEWVDPGDPNAWLRLSTFDAEVWPNPAVNLGGKIRMKVTNKGDFIDGQLGICLGIRETGEAVPQFEDGGTSGDIEWVGVSGTVGSEPDIRPVPVYTLPVSSTHTVVEFDLSTGNVSVGPSVGSLTSLGGGIAAFTGDGVLDGTYGTLEHIALTNVTGDPATMMEVFFDDIQAESPDPDPVFPPTVQSPIIKGDDKIYVIDLLSTTDQVSLYRDGGFVASLPVTDPNLPVEFTITPLADTGECFTATQREGISGDTSVLSDPVCALPAAAAYTFNVCLDENGSNCSTDWEMIPAESKGTSPNGDIAPHGQIIFPDSAVWQTIDIPLNDPLFVTAWLGGDGDVDPGAGQFSFDSFWFTSLGGPDALANHEVFLDSIEALDGADNVIASIYTFDDGVNQMSNTRTQSSSSFTTSTPSTLASFAGGGSHRLTWTYNTTDIDETVATYNAIGWACGTAPTFPDTTQTIRVRLLARAEFTGTAPLPEVVGPIVGNQTGVRVLNDPNAIGVQLYVDGQPEGLPVLPSGPETDFTGLSLTPGQSISVRQELAVDGFSDYAYPVPVRTQPDIPALTTPIAPQSEAVTVTGITNAAPHAVASLVEVYVNDAFAGSVTDPNSETAVVSVPALGSGQSVKVRQQVNGVWSEFSTPVTVALTAPVIYYVPAAGDVGVLVTEIDPNATDVTVTVNGTDYTETYDPNIAPFVVTTPPLTAGHEVVATYTVGPDSSTGSVPETVCQSTIVDVFCDDFEYANQAAFDLVWSSVATQMILSEDQNTSLPSPPAMKSAYAPDRNYRSSAGVLTGAQGTDLEPVVFSINILDPTGGSGTSQYADADNLTSDFFLAEIGIYNGAGPTTHYQARLVSNGGPGWIQLDQFDAPNRSAGWHNFMMVFKGPPEGETTGHEIDMYVDGLLARKNVILTDDTTLREPRIGAGLSASGAPEGYFDDYCLYTGPPEFPDLPPAPPSLGSPIESGDETVTVNSISSTSTLVSVYANGGLIGSIDPNGADTVAVPVTPLIHLDAITATQTTAAGLESIPSSSIEVGNGNGPLYLAIGVRETGDLGALGTPGSTAAADLEWIGATGKVDGAPRGVRVEPLPMWQTVTFDPNLVENFFGNGTLEETRGVLDHLAVAVDPNATNRSTGAYQIYIDNVINVGAAPGDLDFMIADFEGLPLGDEALFQEPGNSGSTGANNLFPPDYSQTVAIGNPGQSQELGWFWIDTQASRWQRIGTIGTDYINSPIIDLTKPIQLDILILERCAVLGDLNGDGVFDAGDLSDLLNCISGPAASSGPACDCADADADGDVDLRDLWLLTPTVGS